MWYIQIDPVNSKVCLVGLFIWLSVVVVVVDDVYYRKLTYTQIPDLTWLYAKCDQQLQFQGTASRRKSVTYYMSHPSSYLLSSLIFGSSRFVGLAPQSHASWFIPQGHRNEMRLVEHAKREVGGYWVVPRSRVDERGLDGDRQWLRDS